MCGRFAQYSSLPDLKKRIPIDSAACDVLPRYNIAPASLVLTVIQREENRLGQVNWGLVPPWAGNTSRAASLINARAETLADKPSFRRAFQKRRCLIPADGFYEWKTEAGLKNPWYITLKGGGPFAFAGLWETWQGPQEAYHSCTIVTTAAGASMREIHQRMPVVLKPEFYPDWLDSGIRDPGRLNRILHEGHLQAFESYPVSRRVNSPEFDGPACIEPL